VIIRIVMTDLSRRTFLAAAGLAPVTAPTFHIPPRRRAQEPVAVSSANGQEAVTIAVQKMAEGTPPVDAAVFGIEPVENDPEDDSVGYGGLPNEEGVVELDACCMDGITGLGGAVAGLRNIKNPVQVALKVLRHTDHVLLVGEGALRFARAFGFKEENLLTERSRQQWLRWKASMSGSDDWVESQENALVGEKPVRKTGTIHVGCVNAQGDCGGATSTSGLAFKIPGRVGDSPLLGCGNYVDNDVGVAGSTGRGEAVILVNGSHTVVECMRQGQSPTDACLSALKRIVAMTKIPRLRNAKGRPDFQVHFYAVNKKGEVGGAAMYPSKYARNLGRGAEIVDAAALFDGR
jgi:N4-(beta-N-acetylglucosaminyl)-L-asparaginase